MARRGRKPKTADQKLREALERQSPAQHILDRRELFSFVKSPKGGELDSEVCDALGQLCALGYFDNHGHDPAEMRDKGRFFGQQYALLMKRTGMKIGSLEPRSVSTGGFGGMTGADLLFDRMDENLPRFERKVLLDLVATPLIGSSPTGEFPIWAQRLIDDELFRRGRFRPSQKMMVGRVGTSERAFLAATIRGLCILVDGALPAR